jgi:hypothetical protein
LGVNVRRKVRGRAYKLGYGDVGGEDNWEGGTG